ncbi:hypothetical protein CHLRE_13g589700v5 [Chlamydomonas reinhardtii]|uniref:Uncharacterized protein n=1 Tax=Chlamydomonas reinhardtii TaxID=3055 RepID=A0A2K3D108_CHLRE|nr:uncharacterized protein CHLRE_13g589700v5 [Chlamydomonas reinhardtii]PNW74212.1 hypothetical protein CHLRE_13g589700v5 [Chlamydomonas reinhardtii]
MGGYYSKSSKKSKGPEITDADRAVLSLKTQRKKLEDQEKLINARLERHAEVARQLAAEGRRDRALLALRKKKLSEKQLAGLHTLIINVEEMLSNIETTKKQTVVFGALQQSNDALKQLQAQVRLEDVQRLLDDTAEAKAYQEELSALLGQQLSDTEDAEVEAELAALEEVVVDEDKMAMPTAPKTKVPEVEAAAAARAAAEAAAKAAAAAAEEEEEAEPEPAVEGRKAEAMLAS